MKRHQESFKPQSETRRNGEKIDTHNMHIHGHSSASKCVKANYPHI
jgi:hypothetical protein